jgi:methionyl aminopeptidase
MPIILKTRREIEQIRRTGQIGCEILAAMREVVRPGITTFEINEVARRLLARHNAVAMSKNYPTYNDGEGYPAETCLSINEEVVHGIPSSRQLREGDIITLDLALRVDGFCADNATTVPVGKVSPQVQKLLDVTADTLAIAIKQIKPGKKWSDIARLMQYNVESHGFNVVREFVGHGVGRSMHEDPKVPNFVTAEQLRGDFKLRPGMTFAVEPMVVLGRRDVRQLPDGWTIVTEDGSPAAHFEHTVAVTELGADVLTDGRPPWGL